MSSGELDEINTLQKMIEMRRTVLVKDLTTSQVDRQNILNNELAIREVQNQTGFQGIIFEDKICFTKAITATYFDVDIRTIERYVSENLKEISINSYVFTEEWIYVNCKQT